MSRSISSLQNVPNVTIRLLNTISTQSPHASNRSFHHQLGNLTETKSLKAVTTTGSSHYSVNPEPQKRATLVMWGWGVASDFHQRCGPNTQGVSSWFRLYLSYVEKVRPPSNLGSSVGLGAPIEKYIVENFPSAVFRSFTGSGGSWREEPPRPVKRGETTNKQMHVSHRIVQAKYKVLFCVPRKTDVLSCFRFHFKRTPTSRFYRSSSLHRIKPHFFTTFFGVEAASNSRQT